MNIVESDRFIKEPSINKTVGGKWKPSEPYFGFQDTRTTIAVPSGELKEGVLQYFCEIGLEFQGPGRCGEISVDNMPIDLVLVRASDIPRTVLSDISRAKAGITGSDLIMEKGREFGTDILEGEEIPLFELVPNPPKSRIYAGVTKRYADRIRKNFEREPEITDLNGQTIVTIFPNITREYISQNNLTDSSVYTVEGMDESYQYIYPYEGIIGITSSGRSVQENNLVIVDTLFKVAVKMVQYGTDKLTTRDMQVLDDLREMTYLALQKKGMV